MGNEHANLVGFNVKVKAAANALAAECQPLGTLIWERKRARGFRAKEVGKSKTFDLV